MKIIACLVAHALSCSTSDVSRLSVGGASVGKYHDSLEITDTTQQGRTLRATLPQGSSCSTTVDRVLEPYPHEQVAQAIHENALPKFLLAQAENATATYAAQYEQNEKRVNQIYYEQVLEQPTDKDTPRFNRANLADLRSIAAQCPYLGGNAVFAARAMLAQQDNTYYNDKALCLEQGILWRTQKPKAEKVVSDLTFKFYPNPAANYATLAVEGNHTDLYLDITDLLGRSITTKQIVEKANSTVLSFDNTPVGMYILTVKNIHGKTIHQQKISILH